MSDKDCPPQAPQKQYPANLGNSITVEPENLVVGYRENISKLGWFADSCTPWMTNRLALFAEPVTPIPSNAAWIVKAIANINFGSGAARSKVEIDFKRGAQLSLPFNAADVSLEIIEVVGEPDTAFRFGALITYGGDARAGYATRTTARQSVVGAGSVFFDVPPFAYAVGLTTATPDNIDGVIFSGSGDAAGAIVGIQGAGVDLELLPADIPGGTQRVGVVTTDDATIEVVYYIQV